MRKLTARKALAQITAELYDRTPFYLVAAKIRGCADSVVIRRYEGDIREVAYTMFCRQRLCPVCAWRRSLKAFWMLSHILDYCDAQRVAQKGKPYEYILLTLTMESVSGDALPEAIDRMYDAYTRLSRRREWKVMKGAWRTLEVTYNPDTDTFHPHLHIIAAVNPSYFTQRGYISQDKLCLLWQDCGRFPYKPICDIRRVSTKIDKKGIYEVAKYATKISSVLFKSQKRAPENILCDLHAALFKRKLFTSYGIMREASRALRMTDEDGDLLNVGEMDSVLAKEMREDLVATMEAYTYIPESGYVHIPSRVLTESDDPKPCILWSQLRDISK